MLLCEFWLPFAKKAGSRDFQANLSCYPSVPTVYSSNCEVKTRCLPVQHSKVAAGEYVQFFMRMQLYVYVWHNKYICIPAAFVEIIYE